jgi:hypothetical protein
VMRPGRYAGGKGLPAEGGDPSLLELQPGE